MNAFSKIKKARKTVRGKPISYASTKPHAGKLGVELNKPSPRMSTGGPNKPAVKSMSTGGPNKPAVRRGKGIGVRTAMSELAGSGRKIIRGKVVTRQRP